MRQLSTIDRLEPRCHLTSVSFTIDRKNSELAIDARVHAPHIGSVHLSPQADGLDTAPLVGTLVADVTTHGVKFDNDSTIDAVAEPGSYLPGDSAADFAVKGRLKKIGITLAQADAAIRDLSVDLSTTRKSVDKKGQFKVSGGTLTATSGTVDYKLDSKFGDSNGSKSFANLSASLDTKTGSLTGAVGSPVLVVPISVVFKEDLKNDVTVTMTLTGRIIGHETTGTASTQAVAVPQSIVTRADVARSIFADDAAVI